MTDISEARKIATGNLDELKRMGDQALKYASCGKVDHAEDVLRLMVKLAAKMQADADATLSASPSPQPVTKASHDVA